MTLAVVLHSNIYDENGGKRLKGESFECSDEFAKSVLDGDKNSGREPRITVIEAPKRGRKNAQDS